MKTEKFDFRRLYDAWDDALIGRKCLISDSLDDIFDCVENDDNWCCIEPETVEKRDERYAVFRSVHDGNIYRYAYVLDEDFADSRLRMVQELNSIVNYPNKNLTKKQFFFLSDLLDYMRSNYETGAF